MLLSHDIARSTALKRSPPGRLDSTSCLQPTAWNSTCLEGLGESQRLPGETKLKHPSHRDRKSSNVRRPFSCDSPASPPADLDALQAGKAVGGKPRSCTFLSPASGRDSFAKVSASVRDQGVAPGHGTSSFRLRTSRKCLPRLPSKPALFSKILSLTCNHGPRYRHFGVRQMYTW